MCMLPAACPPPSVAPRLPPAQCGTGCAACTEAQTCSKCASLSLVGGKCVRCEDPRCDDCSGNAAVCRKCVEARFVPDPNTKRCRLKTHIPMPTPGDSTRGRHVWVAAPVPAVGGWDDVWQSVSICALVLVAGNTQLLSLAVLTCCPASSAPPPATYCRRMQGPTGRPVSSPKEAAATAAAVAAAAAGEAGSPARPQPAIIGGKSAAQGRFPWVAQLRLNSKRELWSQFCGASLVHPQVLLTAAHVSV